MNLQSNYVKGETVQNPYSKPDPENSKLVARVYHERAWQSQKGQTSGMTHYMAYTQEVKDYNQDTADQIEFGRLVRVMESKFTGKYRDNPVKTVVLYQNWNRGGSREFDEEGVKVENPPLLKFSIKDNRIHTSEILIDPNHRFWYDFANSILDQIDAALIKSFK